jgi:hypothetical protein
MTRAQLSEEVGIRGESKNVFARNDATKMGFAQLGHKFSDAEVRIKDDAYPVVELQSRMQDQRILKRQNLNLRNRQASCSANPFSKRYIIQLGTFASKEWGLRVVYRSREETASRVAQRNRRSD